MRITHFIHQLNPFGSERVLETLLRYRSASFRDQHVVALRDGPMRIVYQQLGVPVSIPGSERELVVRLLDGGIVNLHLLKPDHVPRSLAGRLGRPKVITIHWAEAFPARMADRFIATSDWAHRLQPDPRRCTLIPNGVDLDRFHGRREASNGRQIIARVGREEKHDELFWYGMSAVLAGHPNAELWTAGVEGISFERVRLLGVLRDVVELFEQSYLFVHAPIPAKGSRDLVPMEAMAMGLPCVFTDADSARESVTGAAEAGAAIVVPRDRPDALADAVRQLLADPAAAAELGRRARAYAAAHFDARPRVALYERVYAEVAGCA